MIDLNVEDEISHPRHYADSCSLECIEVMEVVFGKEIVFFFCVCNAFKYLWRYKNKNGQKDLGKASWYLIYAKNLVSKNDIEKQGMLERLSNLLLKCSRKD